MTNTTTDFQLLFNDSIMPVGYGQDFVCLEVTQTNLAIFQQGISSQLFQNTANMLFSYVILSILFFWLKNKIVIKYMQTHDFQKDMFFFDYVFEMIYMGFYIGIGTLKAIVDPNVSFWIIFFIGLFPIFYYLQKKLYILLKDVDFSKIHKNIES